MSDQKQMKLIRKNTSLARRIAKKREETVNLMLENAELKHKLGLYEHFFGKIDHIAVTDFSYKVKPDTVDIFIRYDNEEDILDIRTRKGGRQGLVEEVVVIGLLETVKHRILARDFVDEEEEYEDD